MKTKIYENFVQFFPLWRETTLEKRGNEIRETKFITDVFRKLHSTIKSVIDLGGGVGTHAIPLLEAGYDMTLLDRSKKALTIAKKKRSGLKIVRGSFEKLSVNKNYDAGICMWSTLTYIFSEKGREVFYGWLKTHIKRAIILDEANFYRYSSSFHKIYLGEDENYKMKVIRDWQLTKKYLKKTKFTYEITDKKTGITKRIRDAENEQYVTLEKIQGYLGSDWHLYHLAGDYDLRKKYKPKSSKRIIAVFVRNDY